MPIAAISIATHANTPSRIALSRGCAALFDTHSSIVRTDDIGSAASRSRTFWRTTGSSDVGGGSVRTTMPIEPVSPRLG